MATTGNIKEQVDALCLGEDVSFLMKRKISLGFFFFMVFWGCSGVNHHNPCNVYEIRHVLETVITIL